MIKFKVLGTETVYYEKIVEAENEDEAYNNFVETISDKDVVDSGNIEVDEIVEVQDER
jgi:ribosomal protein L20A (L18A)